MRSQNVHDTIGSIASSPMALFDDPDDGDTEFGSGDLIKIHFERATNVTEELINEEMDEAAVDLLFTPAQLA